MSWQQLIVQATPDNAETVSSLLQAQQAASVTLSDAKDQPIFEPERGTTPLWNSVNVTALFESEIDLNPVVTALEQALGHAPTYIIEQLEDKDWVRAWMDDFKPMQFGQRVWIIPSHHNAPDPDAINIELDPGLAFGTGTHPTTAMCLRWLDQHCCTESDSVLDYGCGSGVLALAAAKLGARAVYAVDNDPQAIDATHANAAHNKVQTISAFLPNAMPELKVEILVANILAAPLVELAPLFQRYCQQGTRVVLAGLLQNQADEIINAYASWCQLEAVDQIEEWVCLAGITGRVV